MPAYPGDFPIAVHPGDILQEMLDERGVTQVQLARHLDTDVARINEICRRRRGSAKMALMLGKAFGTSAVLWMNLPEELGTESDLCRCCQPCKAAAAIGVRDYCLAMPHVFWTPSWLDALLTCLLGRIDFFSGLHETSLEWLADFLPGSVDAATAAETLTHGGFRSR